jgi:hypothetical protein
VDVSVGERGVGGASERYRPSQHEEDESEADPAAH